MRGKIRSKRKFWEVQIPIIIFAFSLRFAYSGFSTGTGRRRECSTCVLRKTTKTFGFCLMKYEAGRFKANVEEALQAFA